MLLKLTYCTQWNKHHRAFSSWHDLNQWRAGGITENCPTFLKYQGEHKKLAIFVHPIPHIPNYLPGFPYLEAQPAPPPLKEPPSHLLYLLDLKLPTVHMTEITASSPSLPSSFHSHINWDIKSFTSSTPVPRLSSLFIQSLLPFQRLWWENVLKNYCIYLWWPHY